MRIKPVVQSITRPKQTGFIKGRFILDNLMLAWETIGWAQQSRKNALLVKLNFDKVYDRIRWDFILKMLHWLGFGPKLQKYVKMLFQDANAQIIINNSLTTPFELQQSIRQGCSLSPFLYVLTADALGYLLHGANHLNLIKRISIPQNQVVINSHFVDDSMLFLQNSEEELTNVLDILDLYCVVSGSQLAHSKIKFMMIHSEKIPKWIPKEWRHIRHGEITRYLGIPFGIGVSLSNMWKWFLSRLKEKLFNWNNRFLSLAGKIQVANKIFIASHVYYLSCWMLSKRKYEELNRLIRKFLWSKWDGNDGFIGASWSHCIQTRHRGGLGIIDPKTQGVCLAAKWILRAAKGDEPWKILVRNCVL